MNIKILGTRGEIKPWAAGRKNHSGVILDGKIMFDLGEKKFLREKPQAVFITHLHPDHAFFVRDNEPLKTQAEIFAPERAKGCPQVKIISKPGEFGGYKITPLPTIHSKNVKSQAYLIEKNGRQLLYTGDMIWIKKEYHRLLKNLDMVITEASFVRQGGTIMRDKSGLLWGHQGAPDLIKFFSRFTKKIILVHFGSWFYKNIQQSKKELEELGRQNGVEAIVGYDGMKMEI